MSTEKKPSQKRKPIGDATRTARAGAYLERLAAAKGKRVVVDLETSALEALKGLLADGYEVTQKSVISKALLDVANRRRNI